MLRFSFVLFLIGTLPLTIVSCKKEEKKPAVSGTTILKHFALTLDGTNYAANFTATQQISGNIISQTTLGSNLIFVLSVADNLTPGTYSMGTNAPCNLVHSDDNNVTSYNSSIGTLTIVTNDTVNDKLSGTYNCTLTRESPAGTKTVTNGEFNIDY